jgi:hypothetical protein
MEWALPLTPVWIKVVGLLAPTPFGFPRDTGGSTPWPPYTGQNSLNHRRELWIVLQTADLIW